MGQNKAEWGKIWTTKLGKIRGKRRDNRKKGKLSEKEGWNKRGKKLYPYR